MPIGKIEAFDETNDNWNAYLEWVEQNFIANDIKEEKQVAVILSLMGNKTYGLLRHLSAPAKPSSLSLKTIVESLQKHLSPKPLLITERFCFHKRNQLEGETASTYIAELKKLILYCEYGASLNDALRDRRVWITQWIYPEMIALRTRVHISKSDGNCISHGSCGKRYLRVTG